VSEIEVKQTRRIVKHFIMLLISQVLGMACVNDISRSFTCHWRV